MSMIVYLNGQWLPLQDAKISVEDRGFMFSDGLYEVVRYYYGKPLAMGMHLDRLNFGLKELRMTLPEATDFAAISDELVRRNKADESAVYWQVTRGAAKRNFVFPSKETKPTVFAIAYPAKVLASDAQTPVLTAVTTQDIRWMRCEIKAISLLPNVLASQEAEDAGCDCAILVRDDIVTEATSRSIFIVENGELVTYPLDGRILDSITRRIAIELAGPLGIKVRETHYSPQRLYAASEVIAVGSTTEIAAVVKVDQKVVGNGKPGPMTNKLFEAYKQYVFKHCRS